MPYRLRPEEIVTIRVLAEKGEPNTRIAHVLGVTEGTVRYHRQRAAEGATDGRRGKARKADPVAAVIAAWMEARREEPRPVNVQELYEHLVAEHEYAGSRRSVLRYVRAHYPKPPIRTYRRVETPPGAQSQTDWAEGFEADLGDGAERLHAFQMTLSHSRRTVVIWSRREDEVSWLACHNGAFCRLGGIPAVNRIDNLKTAVGRGAGPWGEVNPAYRAYARAVGFHVDACRPRRPFEKGKAEVKVKLARRLVDPRGRRFDGIADLQAWTDAQLEAWARRAICPVTGETVFSTWEAEKGRLRPLPLLPEPFDVAVCRPVTRDCLVNFENRSYAVPFAYVDRRVEVRGCAGKVQIVADGKVLREYPRGTKERLLLDPTCYEGKGTERVAAPPPLGAMARKLQEILETPVEQRPIDLYAALEEVAR
jgi:transposase